MDSGLKTMSSLFGGPKVFSIPSYQRHYSWEEDQWKDFWLDAYYHTPGKKYFFGTVLLKESDKDGDFEKYEVVDGQQRLTTTVIFMYTVIERIQALDKHYQLQLKIDKYIRYYDTHKLKLAPEDNEFFQTYILSTTDNPISFKTPSQRRLHEAKKKFREGVAEISSIDRLLSLITMIEDSEIIVYSVKDSAEATLIFETTNDRGKELTNLEKLKSFFMYRSYLSAGTGSADAIDRINTRFGDIYRTLEVLKSLFSKRGIIEVSEDQIAQYHFIAEYNWANKSDYQNYVTTIKTFLTSLGNASEHEKVMAFIEAYTSSLRDTFETFRIIVQMTSKELDEVIYIGKIAIFFPLLISCYKHDKSENKSAFAQAVKDLLRFSVLMYAFNTLRRKDLTYVFNVLAYDFHRKKSYTLVTETLQQWIKDYCSELTKSLSEENLYNIIPKKFQNYLFWKYENYLRTTFQPKSNEMSFSEFNDESGTYRITIDHITAQTPLNDLVFDRPEDFDEKYLHSVGNLTIAPQSSNSSMGNEIWDVKNSRYFQNAPFKTQLELSSFVEGNTWNIDAINKRREKIIAFAVAHWQA